VATNMKVSGTSRTGSTRRTVVAAANRLVPAALVVWGLYALLGYLITHQLKNSALTRWDASVDRTLAAHRSSGWNTVTHYATFAAETTTVIALGVVVFVLLRLRLKRWRESWFIAIALIGEVTIFVCTTLVVDRARPSVQHLDGAPPTSSFPSGHTAASVALYGSLAVLAWSASRRGWVRGLFTVLAVAVPIAVAGSRLYRGMHFPTDVMAGALLGILWLTIVSRVVLARRK
jgi:membrane-associated phospholipid phosphatase